ncbi:MAG: DUF4384 domain-containing protein [Acidobacteria bacterium]|nr:DUF4384 domain-containing protein [Acidobacteriota bacterium]MBK8810140.1 DUF4384 domain-containing protein [Acidobacteriota bacterium]
MRKFRVISFGLAFAAAAILLSSVPAAAQIDQVSSVKTRAKTTIRPKAKPVSKKVDIKRKVTIYRVDKKSRSNYKKKKTVRKVVVQLLAAQLRLLTVDADGKETETNPLAAFTPNDRLRLSIKTNQRGYLYVIRQTAPDAVGEIIFPTTLVNNGSNYVAANTEYVLPRGCPAEFAPDQRDCALRLTSFDDAPQEFFTLIFTRDSLVDLPNDVKNTRVSLANLMSAGKLEAKTLVDLIEDSGQDLVSQQGDTPFAVRIVNINPKDNEEIIETFVLGKLKHQ